MNEPKTWDLWKFLKEYPQHRYLFEQWYGKNEIDSVTKFGSMYHFMFWRYYIVELETPYIDPENGVLSFNGGKLTHPTERTECIVLSKVIKY